jgi:hypothetical protein
MRERLEAFVKQKQEGTGESSFWERFRFIKNEKSRKKHLKRLRQCNEDMDLFVQSACKAADRKAAVSRLQRCPSSQLRALSRRLFSTLHKCWKCQCQAQHQARFNLDSCGTMMHETQLQKSGLFFDFFVSQLPPQGQQKWLEASVTINSSP